MFHLAERDDYTARLIGCFRLAIMTALPTVCARRPMQCSLLTAGCRVCLALAVLTLGHLTAHAGDVSPASSFSADVMAVLSKAGCNAGTCHGNQNGKGGFKLSLRGQDPVAREGRSPRADRVPGRGRLGGSRRLRSGTQVGQADDPRRAARRDRLDIGRA